MDDKYLRRHRDELSASSAALTPICIVVDTSASMNRKDRHGVKRIERLNEGVREFIEEIKKDDILADSVEIAAVTFNIDTKDVNFLTLDNINLEDFHFIASGHSGDTPKGVEAALKLLEKEKQFLKDNKKKYNQPWIVIMSDGRATPGKDMYIPGTKRKDFTEIDHRLDIVQKKTKKMEADKKLTVIPVLISETTDGEYEKAKLQMQGFTNSNRCKEIGDGASQVSFKEFFKIFSKSVSVNNADLMFADASSSNSGNKKKKEKNQQNDYIDSREALKMLEDIPIFADTDVNSFGNNEDNSDEIDEVTRLKIEATNTAVEYDEIDNIDNIDDIDDIDDIDNIDDSEKNTAIEVESEAEEIVSEVNSTKVDLGAMPKTVLTVTKFTVTDDSYLERLLADLDDDWDNI